MASHVERDASDVGSACRRRERRLRSMLRHERQSIAMALAVALHHSAGPSTKKVVGRREGKDEVEYEKYVCLRAQKTPLPGKRPGVPTEPEAQVGAVTAGYLAAPGPLLSAPVLAAVDQSTATYLLQAALLKKRKRRRKRRGRLWRLRGERPSRRGSCVTGGSRTSSMPWWTSTSATPLPSCAGWWSLRRSSKSSMPPGPGPPQLLHPGRRRRGGRCGGERGEGLGTPSHHLGCHFWTLGFGAGFWFLVPTIYVAILAHCGCPRCWLDSGYILTSVYRGFGERRLLENVDVFSAILGLSVDTRPCVSLRDIWKIGGFSTASCIWQSLVRLRSCLRSTVIRFSGRRLPDFSYSALLGSTVDTCYCQSTVLWVLFPYTAQCLDLSGTCCASVTEFAFFHVFT